MIRYYRYGYNGMEKDDEVKGNGNSYTTEFRQYDPRIGRWMSLDPLMMDFPSISPYVAFNNNPIIYTDPEGLSPIDGIVNAFKSVGNAIKDAFIRVFKGKEISGSNGTRYYRPNGLNLKLNFEFFKGIGGKIGDFFKKIGGNDFSKVLGQSLPKQIVIGNMSWDRREHRGTTLLNSPYHYTRAPRFFKLPNYSFEKSQISIPVPRLFNIDKNGNYQGGNGSWYRNDGVKLNGVGIFLFNNLPIPDKHVLTSQSGFSFGLNRTFLRRGPGLLFMFGAGTVNIATYGALDPTSPLPDANSSFYNWITIKPRIQKVNFTIISKMTTNYSWYKF
ncbi:MAG: hypothetical protein HYU67_08690 [Flavobacteriia bacterium]|nr:hypothetical protein [Flavobacteriia bacterium]